MTDHKDHQEEEEEPRPRVRVTDKRRVHVDDTESAQASRDSSAGEVGASVRERGVAGAGGSSASEASRRSEAPPGHSEPRASDIEEAKKQAEEYREHLQRLAADFDNYRKRVVKEQTRLVDTASEPLVRRLLEVLDEFDLALMAAEQRPDFDRFLHGVELVYAKLKDILRSEGLERIEAEGKRFDPSLHEALMQSGESEGEPVVADVLRPGYTMKGRVIRPAGVKVVRK